MGWGMAGQIAMKLARFRSKEGVDPRLQKTGRQPTVSGARCVRFEHRSAANPRNCSRSDGLLISRAVSECETGAGGVGGDGQPAGGRGYEDSSHIPTSRAS